MQPHGSWGQKQGPTVPDQKRPTPENPNQTNPHSTDRQTPVQSIPQVRDIHVGSYRPHECLVILRSFYSSISLISAIYLSFNSNHSPLNLLFSYDLCNELSKAKAIFRLENPFEVISSIVGFSLCKVFSRYSGLLDIPIL